MENKKIGDEIFEHIGNHWLRYVAMMVTGSLTGMAAWNLTGFAPYVLAIIALAEGASIYWFSQMQKHENRMQAVIAVAGTGIAWIAIILTDLASATIIARMANLEVFTAFAQVPVWAQNTVVYVVPSLAVVHLILATLHHYFSETASAIRTNESIKREAKMDIERSKQEELRRLAQLRADSVGKEHARLEWEKILALPVSGASTDTNPTPPPSRN